MVDYSQSIMSIVEKHLSPTPQYASGQKQFGRIGLEQDAETDRIISEVREHACDEIKKEYAGGLMRKAAFVRKTHKRRKG